MDHIWGPTSPAYLSETGEIVNDKGGSHGETRILLD
jgi:hypothetical protein